MHVELQVIPDCPGTAEASMLVRAALDDLGHRDLSFSVRVVETEDEARCRGFAGSPTFTVDGLDVFANFGAAGSLACRVYPTPAGLRNVPSADDLREALERHLTPRTLDERLLRAGVDPRCDALTAWRLLRAAEGPRTTVIDLYELVARPRGLGAHELPVEERLQLARAVLPQIWPGYEVTEGTERRLDPVEVVEYDERWPTLFQQWRSRLADVLGRGRRIEHVGSTAVPGLAAKPVIDIQVSVPDLADEDTYVPAIESTGLQLRTRDQLHRFFRPAPDRPRELHVHVCQAGGDWEREHLELRDVLRQHAWAREEYAAAKRLAVRRWGDDRLAYTDAKTDAILRILERSRRPPSP